MSPEELRRQFTQAEIRQATQGLQQVASGHRPGFMARLGAGFATTPEGEVDILKSRGFDAVAQGDEVFINTPAGRVRVDPKGFDIGDIADLGGEAPATVLGAAGGVAGFASPVPGGAFVGAGGGAAAGDFLRQKIAQSLGSGEETNLGRVALEGAMGVAGEGIGRGAVKLAGGLFKRSRTAPDVARTVDQMADFDSKFGTNLEDLAPADVQSGSDFLGQATQRTRESQFGGQRLREGQDIPFQREVESGFEAIRSQSGATPGRSRGLFADRVGEAQAGQDLKQAAGETMRSRGRTRGQLFDDFKGQIDPSQPPVLENTFSAVDEIANSNVFKRQKTGAQGLNVLHTAVDEAKAIKTFDELETLRQAVGDEIDSFDPVRMSRGVQGQLQKLRGALRADEETFLALGGGTGSEAAQQSGRRARAFARDMFTLDESSTQRLFRDDLKLSEIPDRLRGMNADEIRRVRQTVGAEGTEGGLQATAQGGQAWQRVAAEVLDDLKMAAKNSQASTRDLFVISGQRLQAALDRFKPGALDEIFGIETAGDLRNYADMVRNATVSERQFANSSRTGIANQSILNDLANFFHNPSAAAGRITGRIFAEQGSGRLLGSQGGKRFLLGTAPFQTKLHSGLLSAIGRLGGQSTVQGLQGN